MSGVNCGPAGLTARRGDCGRLDPSVPLPSRLSVDSVKRRKLHHYRRGPTTAQKDLIVEVELLVELNGHAFYKRVNDNYRLGKFTASLYLICVTPMSYIDRAD